jgi:hypothetical protein
MKQRILIDRRLGAYVLVSLFFWVALWIFWGGTGESGSSSTHLGLQGAVVNGLLVLPLLRGFEWARWLLIAEAFVNGGLIASLGVPPFGPSYGLMAFVALLQIALLLSVGWDRPSRNLGRVPGSRGRRLTS